MLDVAVAAAMSRDDRQLAALDDLPAAVYVTDSEGIITFYNKACIPFTGRVPTLGKDRWCVTWKLYTDEGDYLPHDKCPMAVAIQTRRPIRNATAVAERPDGTRVNFRPYPTPLFGKDGSFFGAVNLLHDTSAESNVVVFPGYEPPEPDEGLKLMRIFLSIKSKYDRDQILQIVERFAAMLKGIRH
jgi:PAS domain-containing protein